MPASRYFDQPTGKGVISTENQPRFGTYGKCLEQIRDSRQAYDVSH